MKYSTCFFRRLYVYYLARKILAHFAELRQSVGNAAPALQEGLAALVHTVTCSDYRRYARSVILDFHDGICSHVDEVWIRRQASSQKTTSFGHFSSLSVLSPTRKRGEAARSGSETSLSCSARRFGHPIAKNSSLSSPPILSLSLLCVHVKEAFKTGVLNLFFRRATHIPRRTLQLSLTPLATPIWNPLLSRHPS